MKTDFPMNLRCTNCKVGEILYDELICNKCKTTFTELEIRNIIAHLLEEKAQKLRCSVELVKYIDSLEEKISDLTNRLNRVSTCYCPFAPVN